MGTDLEVKDQADVQTPLLISMGIGFLFGVFLCYLHVKIVKSMVEERLSHIPRAKKVKKKSKKKKKKKKKKRKK